MKPANAKSRQWYLRRSCTRLALGTALVITALKLGSAPLATADRLESDSYVIQFSNLNLTSGTKTGTSYTVTDTVGQTAPGEYGTTGYKVYAGFQYMYALPRFSFRILDLLITLGDNITPYSFAQDNNEMVITTRSGGYAIFASADHELRKIGGPSAPSIPFTTCDSGCSISSAGVWNSAQNVGFGFSVSGAHRSADFVDATYFRPFSDLSAAEEPQVIAEHASVVSNDVLGVNYRLSVAGAQEAGLYQTAVTYTAVPTY